MIPVHDIFCSESQILNHYKLTNTNEHSACTQSGCLKNHAYSRIINFVSTQYLVFSILKYKERSAPQFVIKGNPTQLWKENKKRPSNGQESLRKERKKKVIHRHVFLEFISPT